MFETVFCSQKIGEFWKLTKTSPKFSEAFHRERFLVTSSKEVTKDRFACPKGGRKLRGIKTNARITTLLLDPETSSG